MPQIFKSGKYYVYFWANENDPLEPIHVHVVEGHPKLTTDGDRIAMLGKVLGKAEED